MMARGLIPPNSKNLGQVGSVIDICILFLTIVGALIILIGLICKEFKTKTSTVRTRLLMMLVFSDLFMGVVGIISPLYYIITSGPNGPDGRFCDALAFLLLASFWSQYLVAMVLAASTYSILVYPLARITRFIQAHYLYAFPIIWALSFVFSGVAWHVAGFDFEAGFCYIGPEGPKFFSDIYAFAPRSIVLIVVVGLYAHLFVFLRRPDRLHTTSSRADEIRSHDGHWWRKGRLGRRVGLERTGQSSTPLDSLERNAAIFSTAEQQRHHKSEVVPLDPKAPWEAIDIDIPDVPDFSFEPPSRRPSEMTAHSKAQPLTPPSDVSTALDARLRSIGSNDDVEANANGQPELVSFASSKNPSDGSLSARLRPPSPSGSEMSSITVSTVDSLSAPPLRLPPKRHAPPPCGRTPASALTRPTMSSGRKMSLKDILDAEASVSLPAGAVDGLQATSSSQIRRNSEGVVLNEESLSSYMNRKASLLMILFPIAYVALFTVSLVRIITDFVIHRPIPVLSGISRFLIFSQGIVDVILYGLVEWKIRRGVQRKTLAGHFDSHASYS